MSDQQSANQAISTWTPVVRWLADVEAAVPNAPEIGGVDTDQVQEAEDAIRAARLAVAALVGSYTTEAAAEAQQQAQQAPQQSGWHQQQPTGQQWSGRSPVGASRPGEQLQQQPGVQQYPTGQQHYAGWQS